MALTMPHTEPRDYYVSIVRSTKQRGLLAGPFMTHTEALGMVEQAKRLACELDTWADFDAFGTMSLPRDVGNPFGKLNQRLGVVPRLPY
jgi:hypothetical protein